LLKQQHQLFVGLLAVVDGVVVASASFAAWAVRRSTIERTWWPESWEHPPKEALVLYTVPVALLCLRWFGLYRPRRDRSLANEVVQVFKASLATMLAVLAVLYATDSSVFRGVYEPLHLWGLTLDAGRVQLGALTVLLPVMLSVHRVAFRVGVRVLRRRGWNQRHVAVIGCGRLGQIVAHTLERNSWTGIQVAYFISHQDKTRRTECVDRPVKGGLADLDAIIREHKPDAVYVALPGSRAACLSQVLTALDKHPVDVRIVPDVSPRYVAQSMSVNELDGMPILSYRETPHHGLGGLTKRALDVLGAVAALLIFGVPMLAVAGLVRLSGPGPIIFKQRRVSIGGQTFDIYKFRTMYHVDDEAAAEPGGPRWTERDDPRVTPIGRWLRKTSLDELPQLFNVLTGDMSLVGPRPERPELIERFREDWRGYMLRQHVKAGMTGWAQVNGHRGQSSLKKRLQYDLFYVKNWSVGFDLKILWLTVFRGFVHRNAH
jgi:Undecaprenyl-phosphate glucose phosphotransferase